MARVIVELRRSEALTGAVARGESFAAVADSVAAAVPALAGLNIDPAFPLVSVPSIARAELEAVIFGFAPRRIDAAALPPEAEDTYIVRGEVPDDEIEGLPARADDSQAIVQIYADVAVEPCPICPGSPPLGSDVDVARLLCVPRLAAVGMNGAGVRVAIVDSGINMAYLNARGKRPRFDAGASWTPPTGGGTPGEQPVDHGTMCAFDACIAAPQCTLADISLLLSRRPGSTAMEGLLSDAVLAYRHLLDLMNRPGRPGVSKSLVVNNSWGMFHPSWDFPVGHPGNYSDNPAHPFNRIIGTLERAGADILFAAGNCGRECPDGRCQNVTDAGIYGGNSHPQVLCVGGVDVTGARVGYSTSGPGRLTPQKPDVCGFTHFRGSGVYTADGGTSAATPVVAGLIAALRTRLPYDPNNPATHPAFLRDLLRRTALERGLPGFDNDYGWGIVNGCRAAGSLRFSATAEATGGVEALVQEIERTVSA
ncbi:MAG TPA: S8 family serine peptidase [Armatimonadota bacterium]|nr:S8 family serine peptidase [Armatimonadota bacterium]